MEWFLGAAVCYFLVIQWKMARQIDDRDLEIQRLKDKINRVEEQGMGRVYLKKEGKWEQL